MANSRAAEQDRRAAGLCPHCGNSPAPGRKYCLALLEYKRSHNRTHRRRRCNVCRRSWRGSGTYCPGCAAVAFSVREPRGECTTLQTTMPGRAEAVARYAERAALGVPLFE